MTVTKILYRVIQALRIVKTSEILLVMKGMVIKVKGKTKS